jgi:hypothetical protein
MEPIEVDRLGDQVLARFDEHRIAVSGGVDRQLNLSKVAGSRGIDYDRSRTAST